MIKAVIVDDEVSNIENLVILINKYCPNVCVTGTATSVDQALQIIKETGPSLLFLDIQLPNESGFDLLKRLGTSDIEVIFVTAYYEYAIQAIRFSAIDYLLKPINADDLVDAVNRAAANAEKRKENDRLTNLIRSIGDRSLMRVAIPTNREIYFISPESILYCKSDNNYTVFHLSNNEKHISSKPIFEYEELLGTFGFVRCHQSYLVNTRYIKSWVKLDGDRLVIHGGHEIPVSRNNKAKVKSAIGL